MAVYEGSRSYGAGFLISRHQEASIRFIYAQNEHDTGMTIPEPPPPIPPVPNPIPPVPEPIPNPEPLPSPDPEPRPQMDEDSESRWASESPAEETYERATGALPGDDERGLAPLPTPQEPPD